MHEGLARIMPEKLARPMEMQRKTNGTKRKPTLEQPSGFGVVRRVGDTQKGEDPTTQTWLARGGSTWIQSQSTRSQR